MQKKYHTIKQLKAIAHNLKPIITIADKGITENILIELNRALNDHELIKIGLRIVDHTQRQNITNELCTQSNSKLIQKIGKVIVLYRKNIDAKFSNVS